MERKWKSNNHLLKTCSINFISNLSVNIAAVFFLMVIALPGFAQNDFKIQDVSGFQDSRHHWMDITDHDQVIMPVKNQPRYQPSDILHIADNLLMYQQPNGGWPKNYDMLAILTDKQKEILLQHKDSLHTTFDNGATYTQIEYLAKAFTLLHDKKYEKAVLNGLNFIFESQYDNGGWPQFYPDVSGYRKYITFNDGAMIGVMRVLQHIVQRKPYYSFINDELRNKAQRSYRKGMDCILKCQIVEHGVPTVWCQQHDNVTLQPVGARTFELASKGSSESSDIVRFLMKEKNPDPKIVEAIKKAVAWFEKVEIKNTVVKTIAAEDTVYKYHEAKSDRVVVTDSAAPPIWTRYYELQTDRPMFANRDGRKVYRLSEVSRERRTGYAWYGYWPQRIIASDYPKWLQKNHQ
jgi:PelA/Pel-15E family pectate lyase